MRLYPKQLTNQQHPFYLLLGDEPWWIETCRAQIKALACSKGFQSGASWLHDANFDWNEILQNWQSLSLFSDKEIVELHLEKLTLGAAGAKALKSIAQADHPDRILIITGPKATQDALKTQWFKALDRLGLYIPCMTPENEHFQRWLEERMHWHQVHLEPQAKAQMLHCFEGQLSAADQALEQFAIEHGSKPLKVEDIEPWSTQQAKFTVYQFADALLMGQATRIMHTLTQLQLEETPYPVLLWSLLQELEKIHRIQSQPSQLSETWKVLRIWPQRQSLYLQASQRLSHALVQQALHHGHQLERQLKQYGKSDPMKLTHLSLLLSNEARHIPWMESSS
jgi:DNA polymerase-3 subunit delta